MENMFAEVLVDVKSLSGSLHYLVPAGLAGKVQAGCRVLVPLQSRRVVGYVVSLSEQAPESGVNYKEIATLLDEEPVFNSHQWELACWLAQRYLCSKVTALQTVIGPALHSRPGRVKKIYPVLSPQGEPDFSRQPGQQKVWQVICQHPGMTRKELVAAAGVSDSLINTMLARGILCTRIEERTPRCSYPVPRQEKQELKLSSWQQMALLEIESHLKQARPGVFLLHGVTGSGKTEVYLRAIETVLGEGRQAIVLVPEIALTPQMVSRFQARFGDKVAVLHSGLSDAKRYDEWQRIRCGAAPVVLGVRSAIFAPLSNIGIIVLDEEHENSYKQEESPRYHARDVALQIAARHNALVVLGSATPSLESYSRALPGGPYKKLVLPQRVTPHSLPPVFLIDMRRELKSGAGGIFSRRLLEAIGERLEMQEQVILFLNRRGYATFVVCRECGLVIKCPYCDISLTYHNSGIMRCHYCNFATSAPLNCPDCQSNQIGYFGTGTQKVEEELRVYFPGAGVLRLDADSTGRRGAHQEIFQAFKEHRADILIGTQMVTKGLDLPGVTLVGVVNADITLHMPDFRAAERTFQLITQVAGRAGRGQQKGEVLVQTFTPDHYSLVFAARHDYEGFFKHEYAQRRLLSYPPFVRLGRIVLAGTEQEEVEAGA
ncbi:MAG: replication restart helicase PriA, partial [Bacillota bacterium]